MDKRLLNFMVLSLVIMMGYMYLQRMVLAPKLAQEQAAQQAAQRADEEAAQKAAEQQAEANAQGAGKADRANDKGAADNQAEVGAAGELNADAAVAPAPLQIVTLGSVDPTSPYRILVQLSNRGAGVERVELSDPRYRDLEDTSAYIGHLGLQDEPQRGCRVGVVGSGTPAALAVDAATGQPSPVQVGDVLVELQGQPVASAAAFQEALRRFKSGQSVTVGLRRGAAGAEQSLTVKINSTARPLEVIRPEPQDEYDPGGHPKSYLMRIERLGKLELPFGQYELKQLPSLAESNWQVKPIGNEARPGFEFRLALPAAAVAPAGLVGGGCEFVKRFWLEPLTAEQQKDPHFPAYHLTMEVEIINRAQEPFAISYAIDGPSGLPLEGWWYSYKTHPRAWGAAGLRDVILKPTGGRHEMITNPSIVKHERTSAQTALSLIRTGSEASVDYLGVDAQYFVSALLPPMSSDDQQAETGLQLNQLATNGFPAHDARAEVIGKIDTLRESRTDVSFEMISPTVTVGTGDADKFAQEYRIFAGPKQHELLSHYGLQESIVFGWFWFVAQPMTRLLHFFHSILFDNYGLAIIMLTVIVRSALYPLGRQQAQSAQKMQELAPEMKRIAEQYKEDMEKRAQAQRELFRKHNYNPLSGCLLMFIQLPIFVGLYRALSVDIELRQAPLIQGMRWCSNLAGPDKLFFWRDYLPTALSGPTGWLGPYLNLLPLISMVLFLIQQKLFTPPPTDEQQEMQQKVMKFMTLFMAVMFFKVPAGLCLYFISSGLWSIGERKLLPKTVPAGGGGSGAAAVSLPVATKPAAATEPAKPAIQLSEQTQQRVDAVKKLFGFNPTPTPETMEEMQRRRKRRKP
ncbi:MAG: YidC/Oxa1 family insertase periplasmic-domain containing protein [Pirellulales bacterium]